MQLKKALLTSFLLSYFAFASLQAQNIHFKFTNSTYDQYALADIRKITFSVTDMNLSMVNGSTVSLPMNTISSFNYSWYNGSTDVSSLTVGSSVAIYPNPTNGRLIINYNPPSSDKVTIEFLTINGELLNSSIHQNTAGSDILSISATDSQGRDLPSGTYLCRIKTSQETVTRKFIITK